MKLKLLEFTMFLIAIPFSLLAIYKLDQTLTGISRCPEEVLEKLKTSKALAIPYKIVIQPWRGRHNVYGIFMLPVKNKSSKELILSVPGVGTFCGGSYDVGTSFEGVQAKPGYYLIKANLRTRTATWLILRGFANKLKDSRNWRVINY